MSYQSLPSTYYDGTATVAAGGTTVTGQGTLWKNAIYPGDFFGVHLGLAIRVLDVVSDTQLTLAKPWPGAAQTTAAYEIMLTPDLSRVRETTRKLLEELGNGTLTSIAQMTGANGQFLMFTGAGAMSAFQSGTTGRAVLAAANAAAALTAMDAVQNGGFASIDETQQIRVGWYPGVSGSVFPALRAQAGSTDLGRVWTDYSAQYEAAAMRTALGAQSALGYNPVRQATGVNMDPNNNVILGWTTAGDGVLLQVNTLQMGYVWCDDRAARAPADMRTKIGAFATTGGTVSGNVSITGSLTASAQVSAATFWVDTDSNAPGNIYFRGGPSASRVPLIAIRRDAVGGGGNAGADFYIDRFSDVGAYIASPFIVNRKYGIVSTPEHPRAQAIPNYPNFSLSSGQQLGLLGDTGGFEFSAGGSGSACTIGGNPGNGGRAVHVQVSGWWRICIWATMLGAGGVMSFANKGSPVWNLYSSSANWGTYSKTQMAYLVAGDYFSWYCTNPVQFAGSQSGVLFEYIQG